VSSREVVVLGSASATPTRHRNHNGYLVRFDEHMVLVDPGEGTQRQATLAGVALARLSAVAVTHFHGDHCLGLPGVVQRLSGDQVTRPMPIVYPASGQAYLDRLLTCSEYVAVTPIEAHPVDTDGPVLVLGGLTLEARALDHRTTAYGYRLSEPDGRRLLPERLVAAGVSGPAVGALQRAGSLVVGGRLVTLEEVSEPRRGQAVAVVMDTRVCAGALALADGADLLVIESTFRHADAHLAQVWGHLTARQAGEVAARAGVRSLVLTHFSQRYPDAEGFAAEAAEVYSGPIHVAADLDRISVPSR
jgi:ribonuclease Z